MAFMVDSIIPIIGLVGLHLSAFFQSRSTLGSRIQNVKTQLIVNFVNV